MEAVDILFLMLKDMFDGVSFGKPIKVDYIYNHKTIDVGYADWVLVYEVTSDIGWLGIETALLDVRSVVAVDVRTANKMRYGKIKERIFNSFRPDKYVFEETGNVIELAQDTDFGWYKTVGAYVDVFQLYDAKNVQLNRGDKVKLTLSDGSVVEGWVWNVYGDEEVYIIKRPAIYWVVSPTRITELSDRMKNLYRFIMDVSVRIFER